MSSERNIIKVYFKGTHLVYSKTQYQYNHGMVLYFADLNLPQAFEAHFANKQNGTSKTTIGSENKVEIPDEYFWSGANEIYAWVYLHSDVDDGETVYEVRIPLVKRAKPTDEEPLPEQESTINRAIAELNHAVEQTSADAEQTSADREAVTALRDEVIDLKDEAEQSAQTATAKANEASESANSASESEQNAHDYADDAKRYAENAFSSKEIAVVKASEAEQAKEDAEQARDDAQDAKSDTIQLKQDVVALKEQTDMNVTHYPKIVDEYWHVWDARQNNFVNTGVDAKGEDGEDGEKGDKGDTGNSGVYIGTEAPTDEDINVWIDTDGQPDSVTGLKYVKDDVSNNGGVIEGWVNLPENPPTGMYINTASGRYSHAEGYATIASGQWSHSENALNTADGEAAHAEGYQTEAHGADSHSEGQYTKARSHASHAEGVSTVAIGTATHAEGYGTKASSNYQHVQGKYNVEDSNDTYAMIVGNGTSDNNRSNAFAIKWDGTMVLANGSEIQPNEMAVCYHISSLYQEQGSTNIVGDIIGTFDPTLPKGKTILMSYEGECYYYSTSYFSYIDYHVWSTPVMYDKTDTTTPRLFVKTFTSYDLQKFTFKKVYLDELATTTTRGLMSATDKQHLDSVYADYSSALTALGVI